MPRRCCMPNCRGNYDNGPKVSVFYFPSDENLRRKWLSAVHRQDWTPSKHSVICELHFNKDDILSSTSMYDPKTGILLTAPLDRRRLRKDAIPSKLPGCPSYLSSHQTAVREDPEIRRGRLENRALQIAIQESVDTHAKMIDAISFDSLEQMKTKLSECEKHSDWVVINKSDSVRLVLLKHNPYPRIFCHVVISSGLLLSVFNNDIEVKCIGNMKFPMKVNNIQVVSDVLKNIYLLYNSSEAPVDNILSLIDQLLQNLLEKLPGNETKITFLKEQISFLKCRSSTQFRYDTNSMIMWSLVHSISPHAYKFLRNTDSFSMPSPNTLSRLCSKLSTNPVIEQQGHQFMSYITNKVGTLSSDDKTVLLLMDEIHLKSQLDYKAGNVVGCAFNTEKFLCATSAYVFMVQSMESPYKDVVSILPVHTIQGDVLFSYIKAVIVKLEAVGFEVVGIVADNNAINKKAMSKFSTPPDVKIKYDHPVQSSPNRPLYYFVDTVHILKCIRNNWFNQKEQILCFPDFSDSLKGGLSSVGALKELHLIEKDELLQYGSSLTLKSLFPNSIERQNVKLVLRIFSDTTVVALDTFGSKKAISNWESTATFIKIINRWWDIVNVKTLLKGQRLRNIFQEPVTSKSHHIQEFLQCFISWLCSWEECSDERKLTRETHSALKHTTAALIDFSDYWLSEKNRSYLLLGKVQTDSLEDRFGKYRQLCGGNYHVSLRQVFETEQKLRAQSMFSLVLRSKVVGDVVIKTTDIFSTHTQIQGLKETSIPEFLNVAVDENVDGIDENTWPLLHYIAGYCSHQAIKKKHCEYCKVFLTTDEMKQGGDDLIMVKDRGGLTYPADDVVVCVTYVYLTIQKILKDQEI
ncbi:uncharacterized protein LOC126162092 [Schistocerca cancellata]|uniref:uncharacterized protein LOC126162092 n=1 Tax=Schistocerca cancellata TaxID=274614 RepID=UPI002117E0C2|nr:uncharacterized protein LOC126162092 [Schistocerca cancellata]